MGRKESRKGTNDKSCRVGSEIQTLANDIYQNKFTTSVQDGVVAPSSPLDRMMRSLSSKEDCKRRSHILQRLGLIVSMVVIVLGYGCVLFQWEKIRQIMEQPKMFGYQMTYMMYPYIKPPAPIFRLDVETETLTTPLCNEIDTVEAVEPLLRYV